MSSPAIHPPIEHPENRRLLAPIKSNFWIPLVLAAFILLAPVIEAGQPLLGLKIDNFWRQIIIVTGINLTLAISLQLINGIAGQFSLGHAGFMAVGAYIGGYAVMTHGGKLDADENRVEWINPGGVLLFMLSILLIAALAGILFYGLYRLVLFTKRFHLKAPVFLFAALALWLIADVVLIKKVNGEPTHLLGALKAFAALLSAVTSTHDWLMLKGAGLAAFVTNHTPHSLLRPACLILSLLGGGAMAAIVGFIVGLPTLRLRGDYLAIATLGTAELIRTAITNSEPLGRATGLSAPVFPQDADPSAEPALQQIYFSPWVFGVALLAFVIVWRIQHSPKGRALQCLREDEIAAGAVGIDVTTHKVLAFVVGAFLAGMAGSLFAHYFGFITPKQFDMTKSIEIVVMVTLGGLGSIPGTIIACILLSLLQPALQTANSWLPAATPKAILDASEYANKYRLVIYALLLILAMLVRSKGWLSFKRKRS